MKISHASLKVDKGNHLGAQIRSRVSMVTLKMWL